ncbi:hypothetical protein AX15_004840 [Amanita polypyramis BW_CC]|nr:hypothetical protein AX15_004840 [Amanita polypyramis BW_CC]
MNVNVLLTNDDGPPNPHESPYVLGLYQHLTKDLGWNVRVVLPSTQKSWIGKAYYIKQTVKGWYFYPRVDGQGETSAHSRPLKDGEIAEWILLDGTPATCANVALHNLYPGQIDLVISGPNLGRNTSAAFALSSGTIGAALSSSLSRTRSIALSYGTVMHPTPTEFFKPAHVLSCRIICHLWNNWGKDEGSLRNGEVDLYNVNMPMVEGLLSEGGLKICWTSIWRNSYGRLFKDVSHSGDKGTSVNRPARAANTLDSGGPPAPLHHLDSNESQDLLFRFSPDMPELIHPAISDLPSGSDGWAIHHGWVSVTPLRASFAEPSSLYTQSSDRIWKL